MQWILPFNSTIEVNIKEKLRSAKWSIDQIVENFISIFQANYNY